MTQTRIRLTRAELHEKVWATPVRTLAKEFGMSDVGLAKIAASTIFLFLHLDIGAKKRQVTKLFHLHCPLPRTALKLWTFMCEIVSRLNWQRWPRNRQPK